MVAVSTQMLSVEKIPPFKTIGFSPRQSGMIDLDAFNALVMEYQDCVFRQALWILKDEDAAADAVQEAFVRAYQHWSSYNGGPFRPWILRIATNYCLDQLRRMKRHQSMSLDIFDDYGQEIEDSPYLRDPDLSVEEKLEQDEEREWIMRCLQRLAPENKLAIILVDLQEMEYAQAANVMGVGLGTFKSRLSRARQQLQQMLRAEAGMRPASLAA